jgi:hypothetical protein
MEDTSLSLPKLKSAGGNLSRCNAQLTATKPAAIITARNHVRPDIT